MNNYPPNFDKDKVENVPPELTNEQYEIQLRAKYIEQLNNFTDNAIRKFDDGRKKYKGQHLFEIDFEKEINQEVLDLVNYSIMRKLSI